MSMLAAICLFATACSGTTVTTEPSENAEGAPAPTVAPPAEIAGPDEPRGESQSMEVAEAALEARESWLARGISTYSYTAQIFMTSGSADSGDATEPTCGSNGGQLTVRVAAGVPIEARVTDVPCVVDTTAPGRIPLTFSEWFKRLSDFGAEALGTDFRLGQFGEPVSMFSEGLEGSIQFDLVDFVPGAAEPDSVVPTTVGGDLDTAQARWQEFAVSDYELTVVRVCRCTPEFRGPFDVAVAGGAVTSVTVEGSPATADIDPDSLTVDGLFQTVAAFGDGDRLDVIFDHIRGIPVVVLADPNLGTADDEVELRVTRFEALPRSIDPVTEALVDLGAAAGSAPAGTTDTDGARFCGVDQADWNSDFIGGDPIARACFVDGVERSIPSVLVQAGPTVEGDPIITVIRVDADGAISEFTDSTQDTFGSGGWSTRTCIGTTPRPDVGTNFFNLSC